MSKWLCRCDCGKETIVSMSNLVSRDSVGCGCARVKDLTNRTFGRLLVIRESGRTRSGNAKWLCKCDCGTEIVVESHSLISENTTSCGCFHREMMSSRNTTHGLSGTSKYFVAQVNKRRELKRNLDCEWTIEMAEALTSFFPVCVIDGSSKKLQIDHARPLSGGFGLKPGNAIILCRSCNCRKNDKDLDQLDQDTREKVVIAAAKFQEYWESIQ